MLVVAALLAFLGFAGDRSDEVRGNTVESVWCNRFLCRPSAVVVRSYQPLDVSGGREVAEVMLVSALPTGVLDVLLGEVLT